MKRDDILQLISNLNIAADLSLGLGGVPEDKVGAVQERLVNLCISEFLRTCKGSTEKYTAPKPPPTRFTPCLSGTMTESLTAVARDKPFIDAMAEHEEKRTGDRNEERANSKDVTAADAEFMTDLAKQIAELPNKRSPIAALVTQPVFERAYSIAGSREELIKRLGISKATVQRLCVKYMPNDKGGNEDE